MKPVYFVLCFTTGVSLMIFSGYVPQAARARGNGSALSASSAGSSRRTPEAGSHWQDRDSDNRPVRGDRVAQVVAAAPARVPHSAAPSPAVPTSEEPDALIAAPAPLDPDGNAGPKEDLEAAEPMPDAAPAGVAGFVPEVAASPSGANETSNGPNSNGPAGFGAEPSPSLGGAPLLPGGKHLTGEHLTDERVAGEPPRPAGEMPALAALVVKGSTVWSGWDELLLDGSLSTGRGLTYLWRQTGGPPATIRDPELPITSATGIAGPVPSWRGLAYKFALTVTDETGATETATVVYTVRAAPALRFRPAAERRFEQRDQYQLAHFTAWRSSDDGAPGVFEIASDTELAFVKTAGGAYTLNAARTDVGYTYEVVVFPGAELGGWVEFLVNTAEKIPAVVQLGVNMEMPIDPSLPLVPGPAAELPAPR